MPCTIIFHKFLKEPLATGKQLPPCNSEGGRVEFLRTIGNRKANEVYFHILLVVCDLLTSVFFSKGKYRW